MATGEALLLARASGIDLDILRRALAGSAASSAFIVKDLGALLDGDYLASFELDRCCEELATVAALARDLDLPSGLTQLVERTYQRALRRYGPATGNSWPWPCWKKKPRSGCATGLLEPSRQPGCAR